MHNAHLKYTHVFFYYIIVTPLVTVSIVWLLKNVHICMSVCMYVSICFISSIDLQYSTPPINQSHVLHSIPQRNQYRTHDKTSNQRHVTVTICHKSVLRTMWCREKNTYKTLLAYKLHSTVSSTWQFGQGAKEHLNVTHPNVPEQAKWIS